MFSFIPCAEGFLLTEKLFDPQKTFSCGQSFRFFPILRGKRYGFEGVAGKRFLRLEKTEKGLLFCGTKEEDLPFWSRFFALDLDYDKIKEEVWTHLPSSRLHLEKAWAAGDGIRVLRQEREEALFTFLLSQNNNIPRITGLVRRLCEEFGERIETPFGQEFCFPSVSVLANASLEEIAETRCGFRAKYISATAKMLQSGEVSLEKVAALPTDKASLELQRLPGVGAKVAACTLLFGFGKWDAFPIDVWMKKVIENRFGGSLPDFGKFCGIAQQFLFYYERKLGGKE